MTAWEPPNGPARHADGRRHPEGGARRPTPGIPARCTSAVASSFPIPGTSDARYLRHLGFKALATTKAGFAFSQGLPDFDLVVSRDRSLAHIAEIATAVDVPVNADFSSGYGREPSDVATASCDALAIGVAGLSTEDATGEPAAPLYDLSLAVERVRAAREAIDRALGYFWLHACGLSPRRGPVTTRLLAPTGENRSPGRR
jgi:Phosphoenolpyruvate phosphomutase